MVEVQAGDEVVITRGDFIEEYSIGRVERVTRSGQIILEGGVRYKANGQATKGNRRIEQSTDEARNRVRLQELQRGLRKAMLRAHGEVHRMDVEQLGRLQEVLIRELGE